jgi:hypothetical protein
MSGRVRVKTVRQTLGNKDIQGLFQGALSGGGPLDNNIVWPKFKRVRMEIGRTIRVIDWLAGRVWLREHFPHEARGISEYLAQLNSEFTEFFGGAPDLDAHLDPLMLQVCGDGSEESMLDLTPDFTMIPPEKLAVFTELYPRAMKSDLVNTAVTICKNLSSHKTFIEDRAKLNKKFLMGAGLVFAPIPRLPAANFKAFFQSREITDNQREQILVYLHKLYHITHDVYEATTLPDIDVEEFVDVVMSSIEDLKKHIPRCDAAFDKLAESVSMLKANFGSYYRDMTISGNPSIIMENFVVDVAGSSSGSSVRMRSQFQKIISHYRKLSKTKPMSGQAKTLFNEIDRNFEELEKAEPSAGDGGGEDGGAAAAAAPAAEPAAEPLLVLVPDGSAADTSRVEEVVDDEEGEAPPLADPAEHKADLLRKRKSRASARRNAARGIEAHLLKPVSIEPSELCQALGD